MIELDFNNFIFKNKVIYYSDSIFDVDGYSSVSFRAIKNKFDTPLFSYREEIHYVIDLTQSLEVIWNNMNRNVHRNIKKAKQNDINIKFNEGYQEFYNIYKDLTKAKKFKWFNIYNLDDIKKYGTLIIAEYKNKIISGSVTLEDKNNIIFWLTASNKYSQIKELKKLSGNAAHLVQWEIIKYAKLKGIKEYNLGGCATYNKINKTLREFKESLGSKPYTYYMYDKDYNIVYKLIRNYYRKIYVHS